MTDLFNPTEEHAALRRTIRDFVEREVDPQAAAHDRSESFNVDLFRKPPLRILATHGTESMIWIGTGNGEWGGTLIGLDPATAGSGSGVL